MKHEDDFMKMQLMFQIQNHDFFQGIYPRSTKLVTSEIHTKNPSDPGVDFLNTVRKKSFFVQHRDKLLT